MTADFNENTQLVMPKPFNLADIKDADRKIEGSSQTYGSVALSVYNTKLQAFRDAQKKLEIENKPVFKMAIESTEQRSYACTA